MPTVAGNIVDTLVASGVKRVYGIPGDSLNGFTDALRVNPQLEWVHVRHEEAASFAASGEAALTGELAVCALRRPALSCAGARHRRSHPQR